jgi:hypothetical protein
MAYPTAGNKPIDGRCAHLLSAIDGIYDGVRAYAMCTV